MLNALKVTIIQKMLRRKRAVSTCPKALQNIAWWHGIDAFPWGAGHGTLR